MRRLHRIFAVLAVFAPPLAQADPAVTASDVRISGNNERTQITLTVSERVPVNVFALDNPARVVIDAPELAFKFAGDAGKKGKGLVSAYRFGHFAPGQSRLVFDISRPALIGDVNIASTVEGAPHKISIELTRTTREKFLQQVQVHATASEKKSAQYVPPEQKLMAEKRSLPLIVLDPGHGGVDPGARASSGYIEKNLTLGFARLLQKRLESTNEVRVLLTRDDDRFIPLRERTQFARTNGAVLFISIHADSFNDRHNSPSGATVYTLSEKASDQEAAAFAERENRADEIGGVEAPPESNEVADILFDLMQRETKSFSISYAHILTNELKGVVGLNQNPRRAAGFIVLRAPDVPAVLLELGYLSNAQDVRLMQGGEWQSQAANAVSDAVIKFIEQVQATGSGKGQKK